MTLNEIVYNIAELVNREQDIEFIEQLEKQVDYYRALLIRRTLENNKAIAPQFVQTIPCAKMEPAMLGDCLGVASNCILYKSVSQIPGFIRLSFGSAIRYIGTINGNTPYDEIDYPSTRYMKYNKYTKRAAGYFIKDGYIYLYNAAPDFIRIEGIFENPSSLKSVLGCKPIEQQDYPVTLDMVQQITQSILSLEGKIIKPENDESEPTTQNSQSQ